MEKIQEITTTIQRKESKSVSIPNYPHSMAERNMHCAILSFSTLEGVHLWDECRCCVCAGTRYALYFPCAPSCVWFCIALCLAFWDSVLLNCGTLHLGWTDSPANSGPSSAPLQHLGSWWALPWLMHAGNQTQVLMLLLSCLSCCKKVLLSETITFQSLNLWDAFITMKESPRPPRLLHR